MKTSMYTLVFGVTAVLAACGGGGGNDIATPPAPVTPPPVVVASVTSVTPDTLTYGKTTTFTVNGANLDKGITLTAPSCNGLVEVAGGTAAQRKFSCTPGATGNLAVTVKATDGTSLSAIAPQVPLPQVTMKTSLGDTVLELYPNNAPVTVNNFLQYVSAGFYTNLIFHRVVPNFVIQGGGFNASLQQAVTRSAIKLEASNGLSNLRGTIAMARTAVADSATSQFFINTVDNVTLDTNGGGYAVFGKVVSGLTTVDKIAAVPTTTVNGVGDVPVTPVVITSMTQTQ